jgi:hypothetical protein
MGLFEDPGVEDEPYYVKPLRDLPLDTAVVRLIATQKNVLNATSVYVYKVASECYKVSSLIQKSH